MLLPKPLDPLIKDRCGEKGTRKVLDRFRWKRKAPHTTLFGSTLRLDQEVTRGMANRMFR